MDWITKLMDELPSYPSWFRYAFYAWLVAIPFLLIGFSNLKSHSVARSIPPALPTASEEAPSATSSNPPGPTPVNSGAVPAASSNPQTSMGAYFEHEKSLEGRFMELREWRRSMSGVSVSWRGYVQGISETEGDKSPELLLHLRATPDGFDAAVGVFPEQMHARLYALQKGDAVRIAGKLKTTISDVPIVVDGTLEFLPRIKDSSTTPH